MIITSLVVAAVFALPSPAQKEGVATPAPVEQSDAGWTRISLGSLDAKSILTLLQGQMGSEVKLRLEGQVLLAQGGGGTIDILRTHLERVAFASGGPDGLMPAPKADLPLVVDGQPISLFALLDMYARGTGLACIIPGDEVSSLQGTPVKVLGRTSIVPAEAPFMIESLLLQSGRMLTLDKVGESTTLRILGRRGSGMHPAPGSLLVPEIHLFHYAHHPAIAITTVVSLPSTDVRSLSNTARQLIRNPNLQQMIPAGSGNSMILSGPGEWVFNLASMLRLSDTIQAEERARLQTLHAQVTEVFILKHAKASDLSSLVHAMMISKKDIHQGLKMTTDPRLNALVISCKEMQLKPIKDLIAQLDIKAQ
ncbi:MAG: hypothetical protein JKY61_09345 [Planctomycetes bacterium]|nr:hypothetical protein [Planctomycetota bacterium]